MLLWYRCLDAGFFAFHSALILFIILGWMWRRTRRANLAVNLATAFSWGVLGFWYGFGYCPCTEWHWQVRRRLGQGDMPRSYIKFLLDHLTGGDAPAGWVDGITAVVFGLVLLLSLTLAVRDWRQSHAQWPKSKPATRSDSFL